MSALLAYRRERFRPAIFVPAIALMVALALWVSGTLPTAQSLVQASVTMTLLVLQFRLWDDPVNKTDTIRFMSIDLISGED